MSTEDQEQSEKYWTEPVKFSIQIPRRLERRLRLWAELKGMSRGELGGNIVAARTEANREEINQGIEEISRLTGATIEKTEENLLRKPQKTDA